MAKAEVSAGTLTRPSGATTPGKRTKHVQGLYDTLFVGLQDVILNR
jgi:hypothetical protein